MLEGVITNFHPLTHTKINYIAKNIKIVLGRHKSLNKNIQQLSRAENRISTQKGSLGR